MVMMDGPRRRRSARVWCCEPVKQSDPGVRPAPPSVAPPAGSTHTRIWERRTPHAVRAVVLGGRDGRGVCAVLWVGRAQENGRGMLDHAGCAWPGAEGDPHVWHDDG